jgi:UbiD family decarboxylase
MTEDLRGWLERIEKEGELKRLEGVHWDLEIGNLTALNSQRRNAPALLFDKIPGYPSGFRVLTGAILTPRRVALTLGLPADGTQQKMIDTARQKLKYWLANLDSFKPRVVSEGPVLQNIKKGKDINVLQFPAPKWHKKDGGRYIGTGHTMVTRDPETNELNLGTYRVMVQNENTLGFHISPGKHGRLHFEKYHARGQKAPILLSLGHNPLVFAASTLSLPMGVEYNYLGAMRGQPVDVIEEEVTGLPMPADSEIVIAGWCPPGKTMPEGPFGEYTGYYASGERQNPIIEVERVYYRHNPILNGAPPSRPPDDGSYHLSLIGSLLIEMELAKLGVPDVKAVWLHESGPGYFFVTIAIKQRFAGHAKQAALYASELSARAGLGGRYVIVVDEDIDVTDINQVVWALCTRSDPEKDLDIIRRVRSTPLDPVIKKPAAGLFASRALITAVRPWEWKDQFPEVVAVDEDVAVGLRKRFGKELGL